MKAKTKAELAKELENLRRTLQETEAKLRTLQKQNQDLDELRRSRDELEIRAQTRTAELARTYKELEEQSRILDSFFKYSITPFVILDKDFNFVQVNEAYAKACQRDISEFKGYNHFELFPHNENEAIFRRVVETKVAHQAFAKPFSFPDHPEWGVTYWNWILTPLLDKRREVEFLVFSLQDVSERKRALDEAAAEHALRESVENSILTGILVVDKRGRITHVNPAFCGMVGWSQEELVGTSPLYKFWMHEDFENQTESFRALLRGRIPGVAFEARLQRKSGESFDALVMVASLKDNEGKASGWAVSIGDITQRKEVERQIHATNVLLELFSKKASRKEYLEAVVDWIKNWSGCHCVGIRVLDKEGFIPYESYAGFSEAFWESENWLSIRHDQCICVRVITGNPDPHDNPMITSYGSFFCGNTLNFEGELSVKGKSRLRGVCLKNGFATLSLVPIRYRDHILGAVHLADQRKDRISVKSLRFMESVAPLIGEAMQRFNLEDEVRESEERLRRLSSQLLTVQESERKRISREIHDSLGQSLSTIKLRLGGILDKMRGTRQKKLAKSLETIVPIVEQSIDEARRIQMDLRPSILDDLGILATISWFCREYKKTFPHITVDTHLNIEENEMPIPLKTAAYRILQEALNNVAKHSKARHVTLSLNKKDGEIELTIQDNGGGFDLEERPSVQRLIPRGLGLTSMRERTEFSGGVFRIESARGKGTTITARWPT